MYVHNLSHHYSTAELSPMLRHPSCDTVCRGYGKGERQTAVFTSRQTKEWCFIKHSF